MNTFRTMILSDYPAVLDLMTHTPGISLREADSPEATARYLARNPGISFVALNGETLCGCIMSGHDGRRGYLQHLIVLPAYRRQGIGSALIQRCLSALEAQGIRKCHVDVFKSNHVAARYWQAQGWQLREDIHRYSLIRGEDPNA